MRPHLTYSAWRWWRKRLPEIIKNAWKVKILFQKLKQIRWSECEDQGSVSQWNRCSKGYRNVERSCNRQAKQIITQSTQTVNKAGDRKRGKESSLRIAHAQRGRCQYKAEILTERIYTKPENVKCCWLGHATFSCISPIQFNIYHFKIIQQQPSWDTQKATPNTLFYPFATYLFIYYATRPLLFPSLFPSSLTGMCH